MMHVLFHIVLLVVSFSTLHAMDQNPEKSEVRETGSNLHHEGRSCPRCGGWIVTPDNSSPFCMNEFCGGTEYGDGDCQSVSKKSICFLRYADKKFYENNLNSVFNEKYKKDPVIDSLSLDDLQQIEEFVRASEEADCFFEAEAECSLQPIHFDFGEKPVVAVLKRKNSPPLLIEGKTEPK